MTEPRDTDQALREMDRTVKEMLGANAERDREIKSLLNGIRTRLDKLEPSGANAMEGEDKAILLGFLGALLLVASVILGTVYFIEQGNESERAKIAQCITEGKDPAACRFAITGKSSVTVDSQ